MWGHDGPVKSLHWTGKANTKLAGLIFRTWWLHLSQHTQCRLIVWTEELCLYRLEYWDIILQLTVSSEEPLGCVISNVGLNLSPLSLTVTSLCLRKINSIACTRQTVMLMGRLHLEQPTQAFLNNLSLFRHLMIGSAPFFGGYFQLRTRHPRTSIPSEYILITNAPQNPLAH